MRRREFMKKFIAIPLVAVMLTALAVPALAGEGDISNKTLTTIGNPQEITVFGRHASAGSETSIVYSVDIEWGSMCFDHVSSTSKNWNPETHSYSNGATSNSWRPAAKEDGETLDSNVIKVTNHSNAEVNCNFSFSPAYWFSESYNPSGTFSDATLKLATGDGREKGNADSKETKLTIKSDNIPSSIDLNRAIGTIAVILSP